MEKHTAPSPRSLTPESFKAGIRRQKFIQMRDEQPEKLYSMETIHEVDDYLHEVEREFVRLIDLYMQKLSPSQEEIEATLRRDELRGRQMANAKLEQATELARADVMAM